MPRFTFTKAERLCGKAAIEYVFKHPFVFRKGMLKFFFVQDFPPELLSVPLAFAVSVPKRAFKKAHDRNLLKRRLREAIRLHKHLLYDHIPEGGHWAVFVSYADNKAAPYAQIEKDIKSGFAKILLQASRPN